MAQVVRWITRHLWGRGTIEVTSEYQSIDLFLQESLTHRWQGGPVVEMDDIFTVGKGTMMGVGPWTLIEIHHDPYWMSGLWVRDDLGGWLIWAGHALWWRTHRAYRRSVWWACQHGLGECHQMYPISWRCLRVPRLGLFS